MSVADHSRVTQSSDLDGFLELGSGIRYALHTVGDFTKLRLYLFQEPVSLVQQLSRYVF